MFTVHYINLTTGADKHYVLGNQNDALELGRSLRLINKGIIVIEIHDVNGIRINY